ncbi:MAG: hypothetical protein JWL90_786 [Chthoniobacteraceae bacterium]|nr:hypothetical protein [Chthoniobacteraceae bacterium]
MPLVPKSVVLLPLAASVLLSVSCLTRPAQQPGGKFVVVAPKAAFYKYGPSQNFGPDFQLSKGQKVTMVNRAYGFSQVKTEDGITGYIAGDDIRPAPPEPVIVAAVTPTMPKSGASGGAGGGGGWVEKHSNVAPTPGSALFDVSDLPVAPLPEDPSPPPPPPE